MRSADTGTMSASPDLMRAQHAAEQRTAFMEREDWPLKWQAATFPLDIRPKPKSDRHRVDDGIDELRRDQALQSMRRGREPV